MSKAGQTALSSAMARSIDSSLETSMSRMAAGERVLASGMTRSPIASPG